MKVLIVEDDGDYADLLAAELRALGYETVVAGDGRSALLAVARDAFEAIILDRMLPHLDGRSMVRQLRDRGQQLPVLMLSALGQSGDKVEGLEAGADDYVVKPTPATEIDARLRAMIRARTWTGGDKDTLRAGDLTVSPGQVRAWRDGRPLELTATEFKLLTELVRNADGYVTRAMLFERLWNYDFEPSTNLVNVHVKTLRRKLIECGGSDPIITKRGVGYMIQA